MRYYTLNIKSNIKENIKTNILHGWKKKSVTLGYFIAVFLYLELILHLVMYKGFGIRIVYPVLFAIVSGSILYLFCNLFPRKASRVVGIIIISLLVLYFEVQLVYHCIFGSFMPLSQLGLGAGAITNFTAQLFHAMYTNIGKMLLIFIPIPLTIVLFCKKWVKPDRIKLIQIPLCIVFTLIFSAATLFTLHACNTNIGSAYAILVDPNTSTEACVRNIGLAATTVQEIKAVINPEDRGTNFLYTDLNVLDNEGKETNSVEINFNQIADTTGDSTVKVISKYLAGVSPTAKNEYTGIAEGYNVITICAEAFSPLLIDPELTPTLYKLSTNGLVFENFYNCFPNTTTNGEYCFNMGMLPNMSRSKVENSFNASVNNYLPYCLGNVLDSLGYTTTAYHNYYATFYDRHMTHKNMGYDFKAISQGLDVKVQNPCSDHDMILESIEDGFMNSDTPFHVYYMTYSGHYQYNWQNDMSAKHKDEVAHLPYSEEVKAYIACNLEVENALTSLMEALEAAGKADKTMIVLTGDHYPYGLSDEQYSELAGETVDTDFEKYRNSFICYIPGIEPVTISNHCSTPDILPTLLNLLGVEYDSRLLAGRDVLSNSPNIAVLYGGNFLTDTFKYNADTGVAESYDGSEVSMQTIQNYRNYVANMFTLSTATLESDYFAHVFDKEKPEEEQSEIINYSDIKSPYIEAAATFMVDNDFMQPTSENKFGNKKNVKVWEFVDVLYKMQGSPDIGMEVEYKPSLAWALNKKLLDTPAVWSTDVTMGMAADIMYRYFTLFAYAPEVDMEKIDAICEENPDISREMIILLNWCHENSIYAFPISDTSYSAENILITRGQMAVYLQRVYFLSQPTD